MRDEPELDPTWTGRYTHDPIVKGMDGLWYFHDETWGPVHGGYATLDICAKALSDYVYFMLDGGLPCLEVYHASDNLLRFPDSYHSR